MIVYLLHYHESSYEPGHVEGVFTTEERANDHIKKCLESRQQCWRHAREDQFSVEEQTTDPEEVQ